MSRQAANGREASREQYNERKRRNYAANPERERERTRRWREANPEKARTAQRRYRNANRAQRNERARQWRIDNPDKSRQSQERYRQAHPGRWLKQAHDLWPEGWAALWAETDGHCYLCGDPLPENGDYRAVVVEHDHRCPHPKGQSCAICRRGLACQDCNVLIGRARDDPDRLHRIEVNLRRAIRRVDANMRRARRQGIALGQLAMFDLTDVAAEPATPGTPVRGRPC